MGLEVEEKSAQRAQLFPKQLAHLHAHRSVLALRGWRLGSTRGWPDPTPIRQWSASGFGRGRGLEVRPGARGRGQRPAPVAPYWPPGWPAGGVRSRVPLGRSQAAGGGAGGSPAANGRASPEQLQRAGAQAAAAAGRWGEARLAEAKRRPGRAGPQAVAAGPWRRQPLLRVAACFSSCWRRRRRRQCSRGRRVSGGGGDRRAGDRRACGPGPASGSLLLFLKHGAGPGAQVAAAGLGFPDPRGRHASRRRGTEAGRGRGSERRRGGGTRPEAQGRPARDSPGAAAAAAAGWPSEVGVSGRGPEGVRPAGTGGAGPPPPPFPVWPCSGLPRPSAGAGAAGAGPGWGPSGCLARSGLGAPRTWQGGGRGSRMAEPPTLRKRDGPKLCV